MTTKGGGGVNSPSHFAMPRYTVSVHVYFDDKSKAPVEVEDLTVEKAFFKAKRLYPEWKAIAISVVRK